VAQLKGAKRQNNQPKLAFGEETKSEARSQSSGGTEASVSECSAESLAPDTRGISIETMVRELGRYLQGWQGYFGFCQTPTVLDRFNKWIRRRLRSAACKQWRTGKTRYARLRELGLSHDLAARTAGHQWGPWRLSRTKALSYAMPAAYFDRLGLPSLRCTPGA
jgi:hypothetical protein